MQLTVGHGVGGEEVEGLGLGHSEHQVSPGGVAGGEGKEVEIGED